MTEDLSIVYIVKNEATKRFKIRNLASIAFFDKFGIQYFPTYKLKLDTIAMYLNEIMLSDTIEVIRVLDVSNFRNLDMQNINKIKNSITKHYISCGWTEFDIPDPTVDIDNDRAKDLTTRFNELKKIEELLDKHINRNKRLIEDYKEKIAQEELRCKEQIALIKSNLESEKASKERQYDNELEEYKNKCDTEAKEYKQKLEQDKEFLLEQYNDLEKDTNFKANQLKSEMESLKKQHEHLLNLIKDGKDGIDKEIAAHRAQKEEEYNNYVYDLAKQKDTDLLKYKEWKEKKKKEAKETLDLAKADYMVTIASLEEKRDRLQQKVDSLEKIDLNEAKKKLESMTPDKLIRVISKTGGNYNMYIEDMLLESYWNKYKKSMDESLIEGAMHCEDKNELKNWLSDYLKN